MRSIYSCFAPFGERDNSQKTVGTQKLLTASQCCPETSEFPVQSGIYCCWICFPSSPNSIHKHQEAPLVQRGRVYTAYQEVGLKQTCFQRARNQCHLLSHKQHFLLWKTPTNAKSKASTGFQTVDTELFVDWWENSCRTKLCLGKGCSLETLLVFSPATHKCQS